MLTNAYGQSRDGLSLVAALALSLVLSVSALTGCGNSGSADDEGGDSTGGVAGVGGKKGKGGTAGGSVGGSAGEGGSLGGSSLGGSSLGGSSGTDVIGGTSGAGPTGGSGGSGGFECTSGGTATPVSLDDLAQRYAEATCSITARCTADGDLYRKASGGCLGFWTPLINSDFVEPVRRGVEAGTVVYDGQAMAACLESLKTIDCGKDPATESTCFCAFQGTVPTGGSCLTAFECAGDARCVPPESGTCQTGTCEPHILEGQECFVPRGDECSADLDCERNPAMPTEGVCMRRLREGASCGASQSPLCSSYLYCRGATSTCERAELVALGEICDPGDGIGCSEGACVITESTASGDLISRCAAIASSGGTCHKGYPDDCPANEYCPLTTSDLLNDTFTEVCSPFLPPGESCDDSLFGADCGTYPFGCGTSQTCETLNDVGEPCETDAGCYSERCSGADPVCDIPTVCN